MVKKHSWKAKELTDNVKKKLKNKEIRRFVNTTYAMNFSKNYAAAVNRSITACSL